MHSSSRRDSRPSWSSSSLGRSSILDRGPLRWLGKDLDFSSSTATSGARARPRILGESYRGLSSSVGMRASSSGKGIDGRATFQDRAQGLAATIEKASKALQEAERDNRLQHEVMEVDKQGRRRSRKSYEEIKHSVEAQQREILADEAQRVAVESLKVELRDEVRIELRKELVNVVKSELRRGMWDELREELRNGMVEDIVDELRHELRPGIEQGLRVEWGARLQQEHEQNNGDDEDHELRNGTHYTSFPTESHPQQAGYHRSINARSASPGAKRKRSADVSDEDENRHKRHRSEEVSDIDSSRSSESDVIDEDDEEVDQVMAAVPDEETDAELDEEDAEDVGQDADELLDEEDEDEALEREIRDFEYTDEEAEDEAYANAHPGQDRQGGASSQQTEVIDLCDSEDEPENAAGGDVDKADPDGSLTSTDRQSDPNAALGGRTPGSVYDGEEEDEDNVEEEQMSRTSSAMHSSLGRTGTPCGNPSQPESVEGEEEEEEEDDSHTLRATASAANVFLESAQSFITEEGVEEDYDEESAAGQGKEIDEEVEEEEEDSENGADAEDLELRERDGLVKEQEDDDDDDDEEIDADEERVDADGGVEAALDASISSHAHPQPYYDPALDQEEGYLVTSSPYAKPRHGGLSNQEISTRLKAEEEERKLFVQLDDGVA
ncbi:MAG: hypothetical protein M1817_006047 [Caeruleum heppii]|nr:MAG: hypothetical protein M1817_006047 [Caeruleum heppii]